jgi:hypothetical protein
LSGPKIRGNSLKAKRNLAMTDVLDDVRDHYRATGLTERLKTALMALGPEDQRLTPEQLGALDQFHTRGRFASKIRKDQERICATRGFGRRAPA